MKRTFLTKTGRSQLQSIKYFRDPFKLVPIASIAEIADKFTRNEILTSNEIRSIIGIKPSTDSKADKLQNSNMPIPAPVSTSATAPTTPAPDNGSSSVMQSALDSLDQSLNDIFTGLGVDG